MQKIDKEKAVEMFRMRIDGFTYDEIAQRMGCSPQNVHDFLKNSVSGRMRIPCKSVYVGLRDWMCLNNYSAKKLYDNMQMFKSVNTVYAKLKGTIPFNLLEIKKILDLTGMTFEQAFGEVDESVLGDENHAR